ncbi:MAG: Phosphatidate cytidylyltransferase [Verrucomicrobiota bacterium]
MDPKPTVFLRRLFSSVMLWGVSLGTIISGHELGFLVVIGGLGMLSLVEYFRMLAAGRLPSFPGLGLFGGAVLTAGGFYFCQRSGVDAAMVFESAALALLVLGLFGRQLLERNGGRPALEAVAYTVFGVVYIPLLFGFVTKLVYLTPRGVSGALTGQYYVLWLILVTKFSDMGAYVTGSLFGKHLLIPSVSPKKTWEGFFGALAFSVGGGWGLVTWIPERLPLLSPGLAAALGLGLGFAAIVGDLAESSIKRSAGAKDSGGLLPGIGGGLDLIDSILFTAPLLYLYLRFFRGAL